MNFTSEAPVLIYIPGASESEVQASRSEVHASESEVQASKSEMQASKSKMQASDSNLFLIKSFSNVRKVHANFIYP